MEVADMIHDETKRKLRELNLSELVSAIEIQQADINYATQPFDERIQRLVDYLYQEKYNDKVKRLIQMSKFRFPKADINDLYYSGRGIDRTIIQELSTCQFVRTNANIILQGFTGSGKTFLACALGKQACKQRIRTYYIRLPNLLMEYDEASHSAKGLEKLLKKYTAYGLLVLDEWLMDDISEAEQHFIFELVERRHDISSTILCTQYRQTDWHTRLGGGVHADAIMDRIVHNAVWVETGTMNMREYYAKNNTITGAGIIS
jgi:DNA replication protein DnaC